jgi:DNA polymerase
MTNSPRVHLDFEGASAADLRKVGLYKYAEHHSTRVWLFRYSFGNGLYFGWKPGDARPVGLLNHIAEGGTVVAHNAAFERRIWRLLRERYPECADWPELKIKQMSCTMARACAMALPPALDTLAQALQLKQQKDMGGHSLMMKMAKPLKIYDDDTYLWNDAPANVERLGTYCVQDVRTEEEADSFLPELTPHERQIWELDQVINDRGIKFDMELVVKAIDVVEIALSKANKLVCQYTDGAVTKVTETAKIVAWLNGRGIETETLRKSDQDDLIVSAKALNDQVAVTVLELRQNASQASVDMEKDGPLVEWVIGTLQTAASLFDIHDTIAMASPSVLGALSKTIRGMIIAEDGCKLVGGDYANIEGRLNAWFSGEAWKIQAFIDYDNGVGPDLYKLAYAKSFGKVVNAVDKGERQIGKIEELALGYQGGVGAFVNMVITYFIKLSAIVNTVKSVSSAAQWDAVADKFAGARDKRGLDEETWTALKIIVINYRAAHPSMTQSWWDLQDAAVEAVFRPNSVVPAYNGKARYFFDPRGNWLYCQLPSGRVLVYPQAHLREVVEEAIEVYAGTWMPIEEVDPLIVQNLVAQGAKIQRRRRTQVCYLGLNKAKQWDSDYLYGGKQAENIISGTARCILDHAMLRVEKAGYPIVLTVHDEILAEVVKTFGSAKDFQRIMEEHPGFVPGLPIKVSAWEDVRYTK